MRASNKGWKILADVMVTEDETDPGFFLPSRYVWMETLLVPVSLGDKPLIENAFTVDGSDQ